jgi:hypothetical protein
MEVIFQSNREPKTLQIEKTEDGRYRILITLKKLGAVTALEYFLDANEAKVLSVALAK